MPCNIFGQGSSVAIRLEDTVVSGIPRLLGKLRITIHSRKVSPEWRGCLFAGDYRQLAMKPLDKRRAIIHAPLASGNYVLAIYNKDDCLWELLLTLETFTLNEAIQEAQRFINRGLFGAALEILLPAIALFPDNPELWELETEVRKKAKTALVTEAERKTKQLVHQARKRVKAAVEERASKKVVDRPRQVTNPDQSKSDNNES